MISHGIASDFIAANHGKKLTQVEAHISLKEDGTFTFSSYINRTGVYSIKNSTPYGMPQSLYKGPYLNCGGASIAAKDIVGLDFDGFTVSHMGGHASVYAYIVEGSGDQTADRVLTQAMEALKIWLIQQLEATRQRALAIEKGLSFLTREIEG